MQRTPKQGRKLKLSGKCGVNLRSKRTEAASTPLIKHLDSPPCLGETTPGYGSPVHSPIPFLCTQDGSHGENEVVWNYYSPTSDNSSSAHTDTPIRKRRKERHYTDFSPVTRIPMKKKLIRPSLKKNEFLKGLKEELLALNKNVQELNKIDQHCVKGSSDSNNICPVPVQRCSPELENSIFFDDNSIFNAPTQIMPVRKTEISTNDNSLSKELDDSMNDVLFKATQVIEEKQVDSHFGKVIPAPNRQVNGIINMDSPKITNDSFENIIGNMDDFEIQLLSQVPQSTSKQSDVYKNNETKTNVVGQSKSIYQHKKEGFKNKNFGKASNKFLSEIDDDSLFNNIPDISSLMSSTTLNCNKNKFIRHNSMPESPGRPPVKRLKDDNSTKSFVRHISMPMQMVTRSSDQNSDDCSQPIRCTPEDIKRKHQAAKEKLLAKKNKVGQTTVSLASIPATSVNNTNTLPVQNNVHRLTDNIKVFSNIKKPAESKIVNDTNKNNNKSSFNFNNKTNTLKEVNINIKEKIEKKRIDALQKLLKKRSFDSVKK